MNLSGNKYTGEKVKGSKDYHVIIKFKWDRFKLNKFLSI